MFASKNISNDFFRNNKWLNLYAVGSKIRSVEPSVFNLMEIILKHHSYTPKQGKGKGKGTNNCWLRKNRKDRDMLTKKSFELLKDIDANNDKEWFSANKDDFKAYVREPFANILVAASKKLENNDLPLIGHQKTMFRQNRYTRFSKDKSPYKTNVSGLLTPSGTKNESAGLVYLQVSKDGGFTASGKYKLDAKSLEPIREKIIEKEKAFDSVLNDLKKAKLEFIENDKLKSMPRGFSTYDKHKHAQYIKLTSLIVRRNLPKKIWLEGDIAKELVTITKQTQSLLDFLNV